MEMHGDGIDEQWLDENTCVDSAAIHTMHNPGSDGDRVRTAFIQHFQQN